MGRNGYIYKITSPTKRIYIGQTINIKKRIYKYSIASCKPQIRLYNSIKKYGWKSHIFEIIEECEDSLLNNRERYWQDTYNVLSKRGLNCELTKTNYKHKIMKKSTINKRSGDNHYLKKMTDEQRKRYFEKYHKNKKRKDKKPQIERSKFGSIEHKKKLGDGRRGKLHNIETRNKMRVAHMGRPGTNNIMLINIVTGVIYKSITEAAKYENINRHTLYNYFKRNGKNKTNLIIYRDEGVAS